MLLTIGIIVVVLVLCYFVSRGDAGGGQGSVDAEEELLHRCLGDREQAERLLALEISRAPTIKRSEAVRRAIRSLRRDVK
jgi:predicted Holliday junction resolvase-like endonuclease